MKSKKLFGVVLLTVCLIFAAGVVSYSSSSNARFALDVKDNLTKKDIVFQIGQTPITEGYFHSKVADAELKINKFKNIKEKGLMKDAPVTLSEKLDETVEKGAEKWAWEQIKYEATIIEEANRKNISITEEEMDNQKKIWEASLKEAKSLIQDGKPVAGDLEQLDLLQELGSDVYWNEYFPNEAKWRLLEIKLRQEQHFENRKDFDDYIFDSMKKINIEVLDPAVEHLL